MKRFFKTSQELVIGTSNLLVERIQSIVVFKIDAFFISVKKKYQVKASQKF